ncbi:MBL fold metallo-hydrolase [uncultured Litoreibacter sp.]|uniref:MBL fold metallo-hydrolase n=1 Tax=uncultured Litoreibacter sp. TaxID=1392394 RepID=UPI00260B6FFA|nr:MBL fold metallo-hydrolase [uncultured Litoreibacter sp.]
MNQKLTYPFEDIPAEGEAVEVADGILWMRLPLPMKLDHVNVYAIADGDGWAIVDTGFYSKRGVTIWDALMAGPLGGKPVRKVIVTHHHPDHIGMAGWFQTEHGAELITTRTAWLMARMLTFDDQPVPTPEAITFYTRGGMDADILEKRKTERPFNFSDCVAALPQGYTRIREGDTLTIGGRKWLVRIGNGHAPEHATLWSDDDVVLGGDQLIPSISPNLGLYPNEPEADPVSDWLEACEGMLQFATPGQLVLPGHKLPFKGLPLRLKQLIDNHHGALDRLLTFLQEPHTAGETFLTLFKREIGGGEYGLALVEAMAHCHHLFLSGQVTRSLRDDGAYLYQTKA